MACSNQHANKMSPKSPTGRSSWDIGHKKRLAAEAKRKGIRATARNHNMSYSVLYSWVIQDYNNLPDTMKRVRGGGRPLK